MGIEHGNGTIVMTIRMDVIFALSFLVSRSRNYGGSMEEPNQFSLKVRYSGHDNIIACMMLGYLIISCSGCRSVVLYFVKPDLTAMQRQHGQESSKKSVFGVLTNHFSQALMAWIRR